MQRRQQTPCIPRRPKQVSRLNQPGEFSSRNESNVSRASPPNDYRFLLIDDLIQNAGQILAEACIRSFSCHQLYPFLILYRTPVRRPKSKQHYQIPINDALRQHTARTREPLEETLRRVIREEIKRAS
jgi:hypothetical protein